MTAGRSVAWLRCYAELNDFLPPACRFTDVVVDFDVSPSVKDLIERVGVPHTEVDLIIVGGESVDFSYRVQDADRISVYPQFEAIDISRISRVRPLPLHEVRFVLDVHLGRLAHYLRLAGFDADYCTARSDSELARASVEEERTLLTRDRGLLKRGAISHGYVVRETRPGAQFVEVLRRFDLSNRVAPFTRCLECNGRLRDATSAEVAERAPPSVRRRYEHFGACPGCGRVYWEGSHRTRLVRFLEEARSLSRPRLRQEGARVSVHLVFGEGPFGSWRLPAGYDLESLRSDLEEAFAKGTFAWVSVELHDDPAARGELLINGRVVPFAAIVEQPDDQTSPSTA